MVESSEQGALPAESAEEVSMAEFLENCPPNQERTVSNLTKGHTTTAKKWVACLVTPEIQLHCADDACNGLRFFRYEGELITLIPRKWTFCYLDYECSNCQRISKKFSVAVLKDDTGKSGTARKIGEIPPFGPPTPARLIKLVGPDRELFLQGRRCENQGLGIGAFVYYRRVVEGQKNRILSEVLKVAEKTGASSDAISEIASALKETQFSKALEGVKHGIPQTLLINGHNPLLLLHDALSDGVHGRTDKECLELATNVRIILVELADRLSQALKDEAELNSALAKLSTIRSKRKDQD